MKKRILSVILLLCMLVTVSCSGGEAEVLEQTSETPEATSDIVEAESDTGAAENGTAELTYDGADTQSPTETEPVSDEPSVEPSVEPTVDDGKSYYAPTIPDDLRFEGGEISILGMERLVEGANGTEDVSVSAISQALYERNKRCEERFGVEIKFTNCQTDWATFIPNAVRNSVQSGSHEYDVVFATQAVQLPLINNGYYLPISEYDHWIDLDKPWWNKGYTESLALNENELYALFGHLTYSHAERTTAVFANVTKLSEYHGITADDLFKLVLDGEWTLDKFTELVNLGYRDLNNNSLVDNGDMFGLSESLGKDFAAYGAGISFTKRDEDGYPVLDVNNERVSGLIDKLVALFNSKNVIDLGNMEHLNYFGDGNALFLCNRLFVAGWAQLREMEDDYVILPYPKLDENVDGYHSVVESNVQIGCVTNMVRDSDIEMISAVLEQMCYDGYRSVTPMYLEELTNEFEDKSYADKQDEIIDMIIKGARTDFLYANDVGGLKNVFSDCVKAGKNNLATYYDSKREAAHNALQRLVDNYEKNKY